MRQAGNYGAVRGGTRNRPCAATTGKQDFIPWDRKAARERSESSRKWNTVRLYSLGILSRAETEAAFSRNHVWRSM